MWQEGFKDLLGEDPKREKDEHINQQMEPVGMDEPVRDDAPVFTAVDQLVGVEQQSPEEIAVVKGIDRDNTGDDDDGDGHGVIINEEYNR
jgi:hypothetical protein